MTAVIHIAGPEVTVGDQLRQRCCWCGALLLDYHLTRIAVPVGADPRPAVWPAGELVAVDGALQHIVEHVDGTDLPNGACGVLDPEVTR